MLAVFAFAAASCIDEIGNTDIPTAETGNEVQFGLSLPDAKTRTVYGDVTGSAFPIYWVDGDKVQIFSPQASEGRNDAEYRVILPSDVKKPNYAKDLVKTGSYGVQWGGGYTYTDDEDVEHTGVHDFYSIYPSGQYTFAEDESGDIWAKGVEISSTQNIDYSSNGPEYAMNNCLMYAYTPMVDMGQIANLNYKPLSTVLWFTLTAAQQAQPQDPKGYQILGVKLTAANTQTIAGSFDINITAEKVEDLELANSIGGNTISTSIYDKSSSQEVTYTLPAGSSISFPIFLAPDAFDINGWKIIINTDKGTYTKTLANTATKLVAGQIHKIALPELAPTEKEWDVTQWMTYIPRNVYLSEVSIPGSWNSLNPDFQGTKTSISDQYNAGVRAFHLDTRWKADYKGYLGDYSESRFSNFQLAVANGGATYEVGTWIGIGSGSRVMRSGAPTFESCLSEITSNVKSDEYMILFCSFAQESYNNVTKTGKTWMQAISDACDENAYVYDARNITTNTVVGDVLNSVIVIVNCENAISNEDLPTDSKCLFVHIPNQLTSDYFPASGFKTDNLHTSSESSSISMAVSQAQLTSSTGTAISDGARGYYPSFTERTNVVNNILNWSQNNYGTSNYAHDKWIYLGLGGNTASSKSSTGDKDTADEVLNTYSPIINNRIAAMGSNNVPFYPVGIVYMNYTVPNSYSVTNNGTTTYYSSSETVKNILMLNNKYRLQYDSTKPVDYVGSDNDGTGDGPMDE